MFYRSEYEKIFDLYKESRHKRVVFTESEINPEIEKERGLSYEGKMSDEEFEKFRIKLGRAKLWLYKRSDYLVYANILSNLKTVPCRFIVDKATGQKKAIKTMAVDPLGNLLINPEFLDGMSEGETIGVLVHETFHHLNDTFGRQGIRDMYRWNVATDYIMNKDIIKDGLELPKKGLIPVEVNGRFYIKDEGLNIDITQLTCEQLYNVLDQQLPDNPEGEEDEDEGEEGDENEGEEGDDEGEEGEGGSSGNNPPPPVQIKIGDPVETKDGKVAGVFKGINPMNNQAIIEPMTEQQIRDYIKNKK